MPRAHIVKVISRGRSQIVPLPKDCEFTCKEVIVNRVGDALILYPRGKGWDVLAQALEGFTPDFMEKRSQPGR